MCLQSVVANDNNDYQKKKKTSVARHIMGERRKRKLIHMTAVACTAILIVKSETSHHHHHHHHHLHLHQPLTARVVEAPQMLMQQSENSQSQRSQSCVRVHVRSQWGGGEAVDGGGVTADYGLE